MSTACASSPTRATSASASRKSARWSDRERSSADVKRLALQQAEALAEKMKAIEAMRRTLIHLAKGCHGDSRPECPIIDALAARVN
jgi:hypothetical protein